MMNRTLLTMLAMSLPCAVPAFAEDMRAKDVEQALATLNKAFETGDKDKIKSLMTADHISVTSYYGGPVGRDEQLQTASDLKITEYKVAKMQTVLLDTDTALITYELTQRGTFKGKLIGILTGTPVPGKEKTFVQKTVPVISFTSAVWVKRDGKWMERFYQETDIGSK